MSIKARLLKRLETIEKSILPRDVDVMVFIEETEEAGTYRVQQNIYHGHDAKPNKADYMEVWNVKANSAQEVADSYQPPQGCKEPLIFMYDIAE